MSCIKNVIVSAATVAPAAFLFGCSDQKKCSQFASKAQCKKGGAKGKVGKDGLSCQWEAKNVTSTCVQNNTKFEQFFNFSLAADFLAHPNATKTVTELVAEKIELDAQLLVETNDDKIAIITAKIEEIVIIIKQTEVSAVNQTSKKAFESCGLAGGSWKRQFAEAQAEESTRIHAPKHQEMIDLIELYENKLLSFKQFMTGDGAQPRDYFRTTGKATLTKDFKIMLTAAEDKSVRIIEDVEEFNSLVIALDADEKTCNAEGGLVSVTEEGVKCLTLSEYIKAESHGDSVDDSTQCAEANKRAQMSLYNSFHWDPAVDPPVADNKTDLMPHPPMLFKWESGKCVVVAKPCEMIWVPVESVLGKSKAVNPTYRYCKAKFTKGQEDTNVQCMDISRLDSACVVDTARNTCGYYGTQSAVELEIGAGICQLVNSTAANSTGTCSDFVSKASKSSTKKQ